MMRLDLEMKTVNKSLCLCSLAMVKVLNQPLGSVVIFCVSVQLESLFIHLPHVLAHHHLHQVALKHSQLEIHLAVVVGQDWHAIPQLVGVRVGGVVDQNHLLYLPIYYS